MSLHVLVGRSGFEGDSPCRRVAVTKREVARRISAHHLTRGGHEVDHCVALVHG